MFGNRTSIFGQMYRGQICLIRKFDVAMMALTIGTTYGLFYCLADAIGALDGTSAASSPLLESPLWSTKQLLVHSTTQDGSCITCRSYFSGSYLKIPA